MLARTPAARQEELDRRSRVELVQQSVGHRHGRYFCRLSREQIDARKATPGLSFEEVKKRLGWE
jgi:hypothetical protein